MPADNRPIPPEALPPGWGETELKDGKLAYRYAQPPLELVADRSTAAHCHPGLGLSRYWELRYRYPLGDRSVSDAIGRVSTRRAAVDGLLECMRRVHRTVESADDHLAVRQVLDRVSFSDFVPRSPNDSRM
ncbi:hypothetical protein [Halobiforma nitratireducens]|uniref:Uncharacterized protein n=1 Tax=Halobiforma nitratireducens JCM 10879 TaxID=1227454 RepID=M0LA45_9EURY|nr:hypothetical protein [Halobiforma nitratireducens]EMA29329.1 hypothetical protein C446_17269 [Halobiforma nitratireducens JCM 10879]